MAQARTLLPTCQQHNCQRQNQRSRGVTKIWTIPGGVHPEERKEQSLQLPLAEIALPKELVFPLSQHIGAPADPVVKVGKRVLGGQLIAAAHGIFSAAIHASTSGTVSAIEERPLPHPSSMPGECIVIEADGEDEHIAYQACEDYMQLSKAEMVKRVRAAGITGLGGASFPTAVKLNPKSNQPVDTFILNGTECEPYITADDMLMQTRAADVVLGAELLAHILGDPERVVIGIEDNKPKAIAAVTEAAKGKAIEVVAFPTKYPSGGEKQLIQILTGREVPSRKLPADIGVVVQNVGTAVAAYEALRFGKPLIQRITTVVGEALETQRNILVRLGTPVAHILAEHGFQPERASRLVMGGPMMGFALDTPDVPVVKSTNCILAPSKAELPPAAPAQACIRCGMCAEACPASLLPQQLYWYAQAEDFDRLKAHNIGDCIECGACSFVCPSNIPLVQYYRAAKGTLRQMDIERQKSDRSRQRFEFRQERIARAEAEKEAKRLARKKAAEKARQQQADKPGAAKADVVSAALASAKPKVVSAEDELAKLQRAVASAQNRLEKLQQKHDESEDAAQRDKFSAQLKQAALRLQEAQAKLDARQAIPAPAEAVAGVAASATTDPNDPVAAAIARAQAKMSMPPAEKLQANIDSLRQRLAKAEAKLAAAKANDGDTVAALQAGVDKMNEKIAAAKQELAALAAPTAATKPEPAARPTAAAPSPAVPPVKAAPKPEKPDAASVAIAKAQQRAAALASMAPRDKLHQQVKSLEGRLEKALERLAKAEADNDDNLDAFRTGVEKTRARLQQARAELESEQ
ncbi:MAG: electron transport complex subunit RsxC [Gammaproteobacteria bacterium]|nr:electron transport complex subunit RsxC [Gammaproteobacteria bacterium]